MEWPLCDEDILLDEIEYRLKMTITFYPTVGSRSNFYRCFQKLFSLGYLWNGYSETRMCGRSNLSIDLKGSELLIWPLDRAQLFTRISSFCFPCLIYGMANRWRARLVVQHWLSAQKGHNFLSDRWITRKFLQGFLEVVFLGVAIEWLLDDEDVLSVKLEYGLKRAITFDPTVGLCSNVYRGSKGCFHWASYGIVVQWRGCLVGSLVYRLKRAITFDPIVGSRSNFYRGFQMLFSLG
jgi:hypothetical protein